MSYINKRVYVMKKLANNTWESFSNAILVDETAEFSISTGIGKKKDTFDLRVNNANNRLFRTYHNGDNSTTGFTLRWGPVPTSYLGTDKLQVYVGSTLYEYVSSGAGALQYTVSGSTLTFGVAPALGTKNIDVRFALFEVDDLVRLYRWSDNTWAGLGTSGQNSALLMEGSISEPSMNINEGGRLLVIQGVGMIEAVFSGLVFLRPREDGEDDVVAEAGSSGEGALQRVVSQLNAINPPLKQLQWASTNDSTTKVIKYSSTYKPAVEIFEELSSGDYTGAGQFIYYVTYDATENEFLVHFKQKPVTTTGTLTEGSSGMKDIRVQKSTDDVINMIIYNAGVDPEGYPMEYPNFRFTAGVGAKWKYVSSTSYIADEILNEEFTNDTAEWDTNSSGERTSMFPIDYANDWLDGDGDWDFAFPARTSTGVPVAGTPSAANHVSATTKATWLEKFRLESKWRGKEVTNRLLDLYEQPRYKVQVSFDAPDFGTSTYVLGEVWKLTIPSFGLVEKQLRIVQIDHSFWESIVHFEEDETTIGGFV